MHVFKLLIGSNFFFHDNVIAVSMCSCIFLLFPGVWCQLDAWSMSVWRWRCCVNSSSASRESMNRTMNIKVAGVALDVRADHMVWLMTPIFTMAFSKATQGSLTWWMIAVFININLFMMSFTCLVHMCNWHVNERHVVCACMSDLATSSATGVAVTDVHLCLVATHWY